jgi:hypothetical protein
MDAKTPTTTTAVSSQEFGFLPTGLGSLLPASHIVHLWLYKNQTVGTNLRAKKYHDQETTFKWAGKEVVDNGEYGGWSVGRS